MSDQEASSDQGAASWLRTNDWSTRIIAAELAEYAGRVNALWALAVDASAKDPARAMARLVDLTILLENHIPLEVADILAVAKAGVDRLGRELPDDPDDSGAAPEPTS